LNLEFSPAGFGYGEWGPFDHAGGVRVGLVEFELHFFEPVGDVVVVDAFYVDGPFVGVILVCAGFSVGWVYGLGYGAVDFAVVLARSGEVCRKDLPKGRQTWTPCTRLNSVELRVSILVYNVRKCIGERYAYGSQEGWVMVIDVLHTLTRFVPDGAGILDEVGWVLESEDFRRDDCWTKLNGVRIRSV